MSAFKENAKAKHCQGKKRKRFSSFLQNLSGASCLCVSDDVFWTEDLIGSPDSNPDRRAQELAEPNGFKVEDLRRVLKVRVGNLLECLYDGGIGIPDF